MPGETLPDPIAEIAEAPDRADFVAALVVLDHAFGDALDIGRVIVEIADQRPHGFQGMVQHGAVIGCRHARLQKGPRLSQPREPHMDIYSGYAGRDHPIPDVAHDPLACTPRPL